MGTPIEYSSEQAFQLPDKSRATIEGDMNEQKFKMTHVFNAGKAWHRTNEDTMEMPEEQAAAEGEQLYLRRVTHLAGLNAGEFTLGPLADNKVNGKSAVGVKVASKGHPDVSLYFDKDSGLLIKSQMKVKDPQSGENPDQETFYQDYKEVDGVKQPMKVIVHRDGKVYVESTNSDMKLYDKLDDKMFDEPK